MGHRIADLPSTAASRAVEAVVFIDENNVVTFCNAAAARLWGLPKEQVVGHDARKLLPTFVHAHNMRSPVEDYTGSGRRVRIEGRDGERTFDLLSVARAQLNGGECYLAFVRTLPGEARRREQMQILSLVADRTDRAVVITDGTLSIRYVNRALGDMLGYDGQEAMGHDLFSLLAEPEGRGNIAKRIRSCIARCVDFAGDVPLRRNTGKEIWVSATITPVIDAKTGDLEHVVAMLADVTHTRLVEDLQRQVLAALAADAGLTDIMDLMCRKVEGLAPGVKCSVLRVSEDNTLAVLAAPSLPADYTAAVDGTPDRKSVV